MAIQLTGSRISSQRHPRPVLQRIDTDAAARLSSFLEPRTARNSSVSSSRSVPAPLECSSPGVSCVSEKQYIRSASAHDVRLAQYSRQSHLRTDTSNSAPHYSYPLHIGSPLTTASTSSTSSFESPGMPLTPFSSSRLSVSEPVGDDDDDEAVDSEDAWNLVPYHIPWGSSYVGYKGGTLPGPSGSACIFLRSPTPLKNQRTGQACEKCRERKAKCSGTRPACARCSARGHICEYTPETKRKVPLRHSVSKPNLGHLAGGGARHRRTHSTPAVGSESPPSPVRSSSLAGFERRSSSSSATSPAPSPSETTQSTETSRSQSPASPAAESHSAANGFLPERRHALSNAEYHLPRSSLGLYFPRHPEEDPADVDATLNIGISAMYRKPSLVEVDYHHQPSHSPGDSHPLSFPPFTNGDGDDDLQALHSYRFPRKIVVPSASLKQDGCMGMDVDGMPPFDPRTPTYAHTHSPNPQRHGDSAMPGIHSYNPAPGPGEFGSSHSFTGPDFSAFAFPPSLDTMAMFSGAFVGQSDSAPYAETERLPMFFAGLSESSHMAPDYSLHPELYSGFSSAYSSSPRNASQVSIGSIDMQHVPDQPPLRSQSDWHVPEYNPGFIPSVISNSCMQPVSS